MSVFVSVSDISLVKSAAIGPGLPAPDRMTTGNTPPIAEVIAVPSAPIPTNEGVREMLPAKALICASR